MPFGDVSDLNVVGNYIWICAMMFINRVNIRWSMIMTGNFIPRILLVCGHFLLAFAVAMALLFCCQSDSPRVAPSKIHGCIRWTWLAEYGTIIWPQILKLFFFDFFLGASHIAHSSRQSCTPCHVPKTDSPPKFVWWMQHWSVAFPCKEVCKVPTPLAYTHCHTAQATCIHTEQHTTQIM